jgi:hypothetical protein
LKVDRSVQQARWVLCLEKTARQKESAGFLAESPCRLFGNLLYF